MDQIERLKKKLEVLRELDSRCSIFGAFRHKYQLNPPLPLSELAQIESKNDIQLHPDYKAMISQLGNGGAGCGYGLERLSLSKAQPPYPGTAHLLRACENPGKITCDMVDPSEISGYVKLFDYGCGIELILIVNGEEQGDLVQFDCDGRFEKITNKTLPDIYEAWLDESTAVLNRVKTKLLNQAPREVIASEQELNNYSVKGMILSVIKASPLPSSYGPEEFYNHLDSAYNSWKERK